MPFSFVRSLTESLLFLLLVAGFARADSVILFNEAKSFWANDKSDEWLELYNQLSIDLDISGWYISGSVQYRFPQGSIIHAGEYFLLAHSLRDKPILERTILYLPRLA